MSTILIRFAGALSLAAALVSCDEAEEEVTEVEVTRPVKTVVIGESNTSGVRNFPARIESSRRADVSFRVPGKVTEILVDEGERVDAGTLIAKLDPADFQLVVDERLSTFEREEANFERAQALIGNGRITKVTFDEREAAFRAAEAALKQAQRDLDYTELKAPFEGEIARRHVEAFEDVQAKQAVLSLRDLESLEVKFDVPERIVIQLVEEEGDVETPAPDVLVSFAAQPDQQFPVTYKEMAAYADAETQTFEVTYSMPSPEDLYVLPGMTATVSMDLGFLDQAESDYVPVEAVVSAIDLSPEVWIVDEEAMTVASRAVEIGQMRGNLLQVTSGLEDGDRVVVAGVPFLYAGMPVSLAPDVEQAVERQEDVEIRRKAEQENAERSDAEQPAASE